MIKNVLLFAFLLTGSLGYSQRDYPKRIVYQGDTVIAILPEHVVKLNLTFEQRDYYFELSDSLAGDREKLKEAVSYYQNALDLVKLERDKTDSLLNYCQSAIRSLRSENEQLRIKAQKRSRELWFWRGTALAGIGAYFLLR